MRLLQVMHVMHVYIYNVYTSDTNKGCNLVKENFSKASASSLANKDQHEPQKVLEGSLVKGNNDSYECILYYVG